MYWRTVKDFTFYEYTKKFVVNHILRWSKFEVDCIDTFTNLKKKYSFNIQYD